MVAHPERFDGSVREAYMLPYRTWADRIAILRFVQEIPIEKRHPNRHLLQELDDGLEQLRDRPLMVVWGKRDWVFHPKYLEGWRKRFPDAEFHVFDDVSHWVVEEAHERVLSLMTDFLERHPLQRG
jgi:haloalkane dehalogenase